MDEQATTDWTPEKEPWEDRFFGLLADTGNVTKAAKGVRIARQTVYSYRAKRADFAERWAEAEELGANALEDEARRRAFAGSDTLVIFLLKAHKPDKYRETIRNEITGAAGSPLRVEYVNDWREAGATTLPAPGTEDRPLPGEET